MIRSFFILLFLGPLWAQQPNIVVIISDDAGYADWGFMDDYLQNLNPGQTKSVVPTPNLDALRQRGTLLTNAYTAAVCSPSRAAIVTGSYQQRIGYEYNINNLMGANDVDGLSPDTTTIFDRMKSEGYITGVVGKWHLGARANDNGLGNRPENQGVDEFFGIWKGSRNYTIGAVSGSGTLRETIASPFSDTVLETTPPWNTTNNYVTNAFGQGAVNFIERHHADADPFFLYVSFTAPHSPIGPSPDINDPRLATLSGTRKNYASMVLTMDKEIGNILSSLEDPTGDGSISLTDNTLVIFINDNGGASSIGADNTPFRDFKGSIFEGGTRVPMIIAGSGLPENATFHSPIHSIDILPTCLDAAGAIPPAKIDGVSLLPYLNSTIHGVPHEVITIRNDTKVSVRKGDWKIAKNTTNSPFLLYDLGEDPRETTDLANSHPEIVTDLLKEFTAFETTIDKPRHAGLGNSPASINLNNTFRLAPQPGSQGSFTPNLILVGDDLRNGNFNTGGGDGVQTFEQTPSWENLGTGTTSENFTNTSLSADGSRNAIIAETSARAAGLDTGYNLSSGEIFQAAFQWRDASNWNDASDLIAVTLFTTSNNIITGTRFNLQQLVSRSSISDSTYQTETLLYSPIDASEEGKRLFVELNAAQTGSGFARLDDFELHRGTLGQKGEPSPPTLLTWSQGSAWIDPQTNSPDTLLRSDSFPGCVLEFPVTMDFSYEANNDLTRISDLSFMLNTVRLSGTFEGESPKSATLSGNELLFTNNLNNSSANLDLEAIGPNFTFFIEQDFVLYHDLEITGDGTSTFILESQISEYQPSVALTKSGTSTLLVKSSPTHTGPTTIAGGEIILAENVSLSSAVIVGENGTLSGNGTLTNSLSGPGSISPGQGIGTLTVHDASPGRLYLEIDGTRSDHLISTGTLDLSNTTLIWSTKNLTKVIYPIISYEALTNGFREVSIPPSGYVFDYQYQGNQIALIRSDHAYQIWSQQTHNLSGADSLFDADPDQDGISNGLEFFTGSDPRQFTKPYPLKVSRTLDSTYIDFPVATLGKAHSFHLQSSTDLINWGDPFPRAQFTIVGEEEHFHKPGLGRFSLGAIIPMDRVRYFRLILQP
ncbi:MAG: sulfatase-like hydrolase/transferase [Akkermansiaceae bacterium]